MSLLFVNACLREGSRTERLARMWLERRAYEGEVSELRLAELDLDSLGTVGQSPLGEYLAGVAEGRFDHPLFSYAKDFARHDEVLIAAPFWNYGVPALLHTYLELVCSQGVTFDISEEGANLSLCHIDRLTYVMTAGGAEPDASDEHAFGYVRTLAKRFWYVPRVDLVAAWGLDGLGVDVDQALEDALQSQR